MQPEYQIPKSRPTISSRLWVLLLLLLTVSFNGMAQTFSEGMGTTALSRESISSYYGKGGFNNDTERGFVYSGSAVLANSNSSADVSLNRYPGASGSNSVYFGPGYVSGNSGPTRSDSPPYNFQIANINTAALSSPSFTFGLLAPTGTAIGTLNAQFQVEFSADGTNYITATYAALTTNTVTSGSIFNQYAITSNIPQVNNLRIRFTRLNNNSNLYRLDDVVLNATAAPAIQVSPTTLIFNNTDVNTQSASQTITVSGQNLTNNIIVTAPNGFLIRTGSNSYTSSLTLTQSGGVVASTIVDVLFAPTAVQSYSGSVTLTSVNAQTRTVAVSGTGVAPAPELTASPNSLTFPTTQVGLTSAVQSFTVSGSNLVNPVTITAPTGFQIRQGANPFSSASITLTPTGGAVNSSIDIRFAPTVDGSYDDVVSVTSSGALTTGVDVSGIATPAPTGPFITANPTSLDFQTVSSSGSAQALTFEISAGNLTAPLVLTGSSGVIRFRDASAGGSFVSGPISITPVSGSVSLRTIEVQLFGPIPNGVFNGNITLTSTGATPVVVNITANNSIGNESTFTVANNLTLFSTVPGLPSAVQSYQVSGRNLLQDIIVRAPQYFQVSLDASFAGITGTGNVITVPRNAGNDIDPAVTVYVRFLPPSALSTTSLIIFTSSPAGSQGLPVEGTSEPSVQILTAPQQILTVVINTASASQALTIKAERVQQNIIISKSVSPNPLNPNNVQQFEISADNVNFSNTLMLTPDQSTFSVNQQIYFRYKPTYLGAAQSTLQFRSNDFNNTNVQSFGANDLLSGRSIDTEPTLRSSPTVTRSGNTATVNFNLPANYAALGYGEGRLIAASTSATLPASSQPLDGEGYLAGSQVYGQGPQIAPGYFVVYSGTTQNATIEGLDPAVTYYFYSFEYNYIDPNFNIAIGGAQNYLSPPVPGVINGIIVPGTPLPVTLVSFTGKLRNNQVALNWVTASELNNKLFEVQRSASGQEFETILTREGKGTTSSRTSYEAVDSQPLMGLSYYRLKQVDRDGTYAYSPVVAINNGGLASATFYPNPTTGKLTIILPQGQAGASQKVYITDLAGRLVRSQELPANGEISLSELQAGTYLVSVGTGANRIVQRVVKQ
ncbi:T9SS type A sorting domain-containing protein [Hymenobacter sp. BT186]|uniref:T9SS type A sorting domain-containing protein n=1 Tax=Hymenobacter telluris TaxID=2816474 RepID=A0A939EYT9_9BACT|nr:T9SS type A sorting domain-containing protein [Hymenobacter telluris]MBO0359586.1 T9SS type A sorting domain-containing protein [Hymenobacter telluris]MBW3375613.1 T9SS type A sorting domain-containing protein [Hymenobacter norwichensis]